MERRILFCYRCNARRGVRSTPIKMIKCPVCHSEIGIDPPSFGHAGHLSRPTDPSSSISLQFRQISVNPSPSPSPSPSSSSSSSSSSGRRSNRSTSSGYSMPSGYTISTSSSPGNYSDLDISEFDQGIPNYSGLDGSEYYQGGDVGISNDVIAMLPVIKVSDTTSACAICLEYFEIFQDMKQMPCQHLFHPKCLYAWLENHSSCPVCRRPMHSIVESAHVETPLAFPAHADRASSDEDEIDESAPVETPLAFPAHADGASSDEDEIDESAPVETPLSFPAQVNRASSEENKDEASEE